MGALAEFERALIAERSQAGMQAARRRGQHLGRPRKLTREQVAHAARMVRDGTETVSGMAALYGVDRVTLHRALKRAAALATSARLEPSHAVCGALCVPWQARIRSCCADARPSCSPSVAGDDRCKREPQ
jgi:hypothetical protein